MQHDADGPNLKRQKVHTDGEESPVPLVRQSRIFAPFRVRHIIHHLSTPCLLLPPDSWTGISHISTLHLPPTRKKNLPDYHLSRAFPSDIRPEARTESRLHNTSADTRGDHSDCGMEKGCLRRMGSQRNKCGAWRVGVPTRKKGRRARVASGRDWEDQQACCHGRMDCWMWFNKVRSLEDGYVGALYHTARLIIECPVRLHLQHAYVLEQDICRPTRWLS